MREGERERKDGEEVIKKQKGRKGKGVSRERR